MFNLITQQISTKIPCQLYTNVKNLAKVEKTTATDVIISALKQYLNSKETESKFKVGDLVNCENYSGEWNLRYIVCCIDGVYGIRINGGISGFQALISFRTVEAI